MPLYQTKYGKIFSELPETETGYPNDVIDWVLSEDKRSAIADLEAKCNSKFEQLKEGYPERETQSWGVQLAEANAYLADNTSPTPFINAALQDGETVEEYAQLIVANNAQWSAYAGSVVKLRRDFERAIDDATTSAEVQQIVDQINSA